MKSMKKKACSAQKKVNNLKVASNEAYNSFK